MKKCSFGIIGCGNMAQAIIRALTMDMTKHFMRTDGLKLSLAVSDTDIEKLDEVKSSDVATFTDNRELISKSDFILIAVKPQVACEAMRDIDFTADKVVMSIMAGVTLEKLRKLTGGATGKLVRIMPNLNAKVGYSVNAFCHEGLSADEEFIVTKILGSFGEYYRVREDMMNAVTGICGSGPAFAFMFIDAFIKKGIECGFSEEAAKALALDTVLGCVENVRNYEGDIASLVGSVCSKGGTTIEGVNHLKECGFEESVKEAIDCAIRRSEEMEKSL